MSSSQISYPAKLQLQTRDDNMVLSLNKGPQRETVTLEEYKIRLARSGQSLQPVIIPGRDDTVRALTLWLPLHDRWSPLLKKEETRAFTSLLLRNEQADVLQIYMDPRSSGVVRLELSRGGTSVQLTWLLDSPVKRGEELPLAPIQIGMGGRRPEPAQYSLKDPPPVKLNRGRLYSFDAPPSLEKIQEDTALLRENKCSFDFYLLNYGTASEWGDWEQPDPNFGDNLTGYADAARSLGARPGIRLSPLTCSRKSELYKSGRSLLLEKGKPLSVRDYRGKTVLYPLDITKEDVRNHIDKALNYYVSRGIKFIHLDHLALLFDQADWADPSLEPRMRLKLLLDILKPFKVRGVQFSASGLPLTGQLNQFDMIFSDSYTPWEGFTYLINLSVSLKNPPPLSLGGIKFSPSKGKCRKEDKQNRIFLHTQALLNGPMLLGDRTEDLDEATLSAWKNWSVDRKPPLMPLEISEYGLNQEVLLLMNRQKMMAILNLSRKTRIVSLKEGELAGGRGYSPSDSTSLKSQELILKMNRESSHYFKV